MSILAHPVGILAFITGYFAKSVYASRLEISQMKWKRIRCQLAVTNDDIQVKAKHIVSRIFIL